MISWITKTDKAYWDNKPNSISRFKIKIFCSLTSLPIYVSTMQYVVLTCKLLQWCPHCIKAHGIYIMAICLKWNSSDHIAICNHCLANGPSTWRIVMHWVSSYARDTHICKQTICHRVSSQPFWDGTQQSSLKRIFESPSLSVDVCIRCNFVTCWEFQDLLICLS